MSFLGTCAFAATVRRWIEFDNKVVKHLNTASFYFARHSYFLWVAGLFSGSLVPVVEGRSVAHPQFFGAGILHSLRSDRARHPVYRVASESGANLLAMPKATKEPTLRAWNLQNGITFDISYPRQPPPIEAIADVLSEFLEYFRERKTEQEIYTERWPPVAYARDGRKFYANCHLFYPGQGNLPADSWINAIIVARIAADQVMHMMKNIEVYRAQDDGWIRDAVATLDKRNGYLDCFELILKRVDTSLTK